MTITKAEIFALARRTPLTRGRVTDLAARIPADLARDAAIEALDTEGAPAAMVLAFAAASAGARLPQALTRALLPEVLSLDHVGPLVYATEGDPSDVLVAFLDDRSGDVELECLVLLLAAEAMVSANANAAEKKSGTRKGSARGGGGDDETPATMLTRGRWLARHQLVAEAAIFLGGAALRIRNADLSSLSVPHVNRARRAKKTIDDTLAAARSSPLEVLADIEGSRVSSGFTVRHETPSVGRNDPCPCGSGKKYKKCHASNENEGAPAATPVRDAAAIGPDQAALLRPSEIAALETSRLSPRAFLEAFRRVVDFRQWELALRMIDEAKARKDPEGAAEATAFTLEALHGAYGARALEAAEKLHARLPADLAEREAFAMECLRAPPDLLAKLDREAEAALRGDADGARGVELAAALIRYHPALGIYVARGALHEGRTHDSRALLELIEDARDRLLLSPFESWWDVYDAFFDSTRGGADERREQKKDDAKRQKMKDDLRLARAASRKTAAEMEKLQRRVAEIDESTAAPQAPRPKAAEVKASTPGEDQAEERRRLKTKIDELQRIIGEGQDERRDLRRQITEREDEEVDDDARTASKPVKPVKTEDADGDPAGMHEAAEIDAPRAILVPRYGDRATKAVTELAADAAEIVLGVVAALAAGKPNAWAGVKQLTKARGVLSARAGIHHRVLFAVRERSLEVFEVIHRRELEQVVTRLARAAT